MFRKLILAAALGGVLSSAASAADKPVYAPPPAWVKPVAIPTKPGDAGGAAVQVLLQNSQAHFGPDGDESFQEIAVKVMTAQGLGAVGNFIVPWRPDTDTLTIHRLNIVRGDQIIDLLAGGKNVTVLRRETNLELSMLDGALTATVQPEGLQVGDVVDMAYTLKSSDPVLMGHSIGFAQLLRPGVVQRAYFRAVWPNAKPIRWRVTEGMGSPQVAPVADGQELVLDESAVEAPKPPAGAPARFNDLAQIEFSEFSSWSQISALMAPLYAKAQTLAPNSPIKAEIDKIAAASRDPKVRAAMALKLVEDKVRYVLLAMNNGGYVPADVDETWIRRFGDCKGKTVLLLALLKGLGIDAEPVLVSTGAGDGLNERLPLVLFDHVLVRATIGGKAYWLDGTRLGDGAIDNLQTPNYHWVLPVTAKGAELERLSPPPYAEPHFESVVKLDARGGLDAPAPAHVEHVFRGDEGLGMHLALQSVSGGDVDRALRDYFRGKIPWIEPKQVSFAYDQATGVTTLSMDGSATIDWAKNSNVRDFAVGDSSLGFNTNLDREPGPNQDAPYAVRFPVYVKRTVTVQLPDKGAGFVLLSGQAVDQKVAGLEFRRHAEIADGVATVEADEQAVAPEFPASEAQSASQALRQLAEYDVVIRADATGGKPTACADTDPAKAIPACGQLIQASTDGKVLFAAHATRGTDYLRTRQFDLAIKDFDEAIQLQPDNAQAHLERGVAQADSGHSDAGLADLDEAIRLKPDLTAAFAARAALYAGRGAFDLALQDNARVMDVSRGSAEAYAGRGAIYATEKDYDSAVRDYSKAIELKADFAAAYAYRAQAYQQSHQWYLAIADFDRIAALGPANASALNNQCWARAQADIELVKALSLCDAALKLSPTASPILNSRAFVHFRRGELTEAMADYDAALKINPKAASSLYVRGIAKRRLGDAAAGDADIAAAKAIDPKAADTYAAFGVTP